MRIAPPALRIATRLALCAALLAGAAACGKAPDGPGRPAPKAMVTGPQSTAPAEPAAGIVRIPASPADDPGAAALPRRPARIWI